MSYIYPVYRPFFTGREKDLVLECIESTWISSKGKFIGEFERRFADWLGVRNASSVSNGTVALHVALKALGIGPGDEVLVPTLTYIASANAVTYCGAKVVFVDSEADYWQMDLEDAERKVTSRTKAVMPVHLYGHACDMDATMALARAYGLSVIEDCAEAIGTRIGDRLAGTWGDVSSFSFFGNKTITTGEGGMVVTDDQARAHLVSKLKGQGLADGREYWHDVVGYNYRMTNICAAIGCAQMDHLDQVIAKKQQIAAWYRDALDGLPLHIHRTRPGTVHSYWMVSIVIDDPAHRDPLRAALKNAGIETRPLFFPIHQMEMYKRPDESYPVAENLSSRGINLPSYPDLSREDVNVICNFVRGYFQAQPSVAGNA
jgi:perosamine synthetase